MYLLKIEANYNREFSRMLVRITGDIFWSR